MLKKSHYLLIFIFALLSFNFAKAHEHLVNPIVKVTAYGSCTEPTNIIINSTLDGAVLTWTAPLNIPSEGYEYYISTSAMPPEITEIPTGITDTEAITLTGLIPGELYNFWLRSNCGPSEKGSWQKASFIVAQFHYTYTAGDINTKHDVNPSITSETECPGLMSIIVPTGYRIKSLGTSYNMTAADEAYMSEQRSLLACLNNNTTEAEVTAGPEENNSGTAVYNRDNIDMAIGLTGTINFELRAWKIWILNTGVPCSTLYNKVDNNTWKIHVVYELCTSSPSPTATQTFCGETTVADLHSGATTTEVIKWYSPEGDLLAEGDAIATGTYTVTQTNVCESAPVSVSVVVTAKPNTPDGPDTQEFETGQTLADLDIEFADGTTVEWFYLDEDVWVSLPAVTPLVDGNVYGVAQSIGGCQSDIYSFTADFVLGSEKFVMKNVNVHPNPASDIVNINGQETIAEIVIINLLGQQVLSQKANTESAKINIGALPQATYILKVQGVNGATASFKIVKITE